MTIKYVWIVYLTQHSVVMNFCLHQALDTTEKIKAEEKSLDHSLGIEDIAAPAIMSCTEAAEDHNKGMGTDAIEAAQGDPIQYNEATATEHAMTHCTNHIADHPHTAACQVTILRTTVDHIHAHHIDH